MKTAADPAASLGPWKWRACASGQPGCQELINDWGIGNQWSLTFPELENVRLVNGTPYVTYVRKYWSGPYSTDQLRALTYIVQPLEGEPLFALSTSGTDHACGATAVHGDYGVSYMIYIHGTPHMTLLGARPWGQLSLLTLHAFTDADLGFQAPQFVGDVQNGSNHLFAQIDGTGAIHQVDIASNAVTTQTPQTLSAAEMLVAPDGMVVLHQSGGAAEGSLYFQHLDGTYESLVVLPSGNYVELMALDRSASNMLVWDEFVDTGSGGTNGFLWTSPYATSAGAITRHKVAALPDNTSGFGWPITANAGVALIVTGDTSARIVRLSDGVGWPITAGAGQHFIASLWVDNDNAYIETSKVVGGYTNGLLRISRASLGAPTLPSGL